MSGVGEASARPPPTPTFYGGTQPSSAPQQSTFPSSTGPSPILQSPGSAGGHMARASPVNGHGPSPSLHSQAPLNSQQRRSSFHYPPLGPVLSDVGNPNGQLALVNGMSHSMPMHYNSGHAAMQQMYGHHMPDQNLQTDRPFRCDQCPQSFNRNHDLKRHKRVHLAVKPFPCGHCDKSFSRKDALERHVLVKGCGKAHATTGIEKIDGSISPDMESQNEMIPEEMKGSSPLDRKEGEVNNLKLPDIGVSTGAFTREVLKSGRFTGQFTHDQLLARKEAIEELIRVFAIIITTRATSDTQRHVVNLLKLERNQVYHNLHQALVTDVHLVKTGEADAMSAKDKVVAWSFSHSPIDARDSEQDEPPLQNTPLLPRVSSEGSLNGLDEDSFIYKSAEFRWLIHNLVLCLESGPELEAWSYTRSLIVDSFTLERTIKLRLDWDPRQFLREQYGHLPAEASLVDVIVLSGSTEDACADTCGAYLRRVWPTSGQDLLMTLQMAINAGDCSSLASQHGTEVSFDGTQTFIDIRGDSLYLLETAEASIWLSTSCRAATKDCVQNARISILRDDPERPFFTTTNQITDDDNSSSAVCWHGMFRNPVIAEAYPMPGRVVGEKGLELSVELMLSLSRAFWAVAYNGSLVLKGVSTMLVPTLKIGESVVWHLRANTDGSRLSYNSGSGPSCIRNLDDAIFAGARHFVGWTNSAEYLVGSQNAMYDGIRFAGGPRTDAGIHAEAAITISGGKFINVGTKIMRGTKDTPEHLKTEDYVRNMDAATRLKVVLSDFETRQHWLADGASVVLHFCRAWLSKTHTRYAPEGIGEQVRCAQSAAGPLASFDTLVSPKNRALQLYMSDIKRKSKASSPESNTISSTDEFTIEQEWFLLQHQAQYYYHWLEQIHDRMSHIRHSANVDLVRPGNKVIGFEFKDLLRGDSPVESYTFELARGAEAWLPYVRGIDAVHIHGANLGQLVRPKAVQNDQPNRCGQSLAAQRGMDFLIAPLSVLKEGIERFKHTDTCAQLAHEVYWYNVDRALQRCHCQRVHSSGRCKALVRKLRDKCPANHYSEASARIPSIFEEYPTGAIILGYEPQRLVKSPPITVETPTIKAHSRESHNADKGHLRYGKRESDSGYGSASNHSHVSGISGEPSPPHDEFKILGAASEVTSRKLYKRQKL